jgi:hypothetical protein
MQLPAGISAQAARLLLYSYLPDRGAAAVAVVAYAIISIAAAAVGVKKKAWYMLPVVLAAVLELAGWGSRLTTAISTAPTVSDFAGQQVLIIISPLLLAIVQYVVLYKLLLLPHPSPPAAAAAAGIVGGTSTSSTGGASSRIGARPAHTSAGSACSSDDVPSNSSRRSSNNESTEVPHGSNGHPVLASAVLWLFTAVEVVCAFLQISGAAVFATDRTRDGLYGRLLLLAGLGVQLVFYTGFVGLVLVIQRHQYFGFRNDRSFRNAFICLLSCALLLKLRLLVRMAEFAQGRLGPVSRQEAFLYVFDFWPVLACFVLLTGLPLCLEPAVSARVSQHERTQALELSPAKPLQLSAHTGPPDSPEGDDRLHIHCS